MTYRPRVASNFKLSSLEKRRDSQAKFPGCTGHHTIRGRHDTGSQFLGHCELKSVQGPYRDARNFLQDRYGTLHLAVFERMHLQESEANVLLEGTDDVPVNPGREVLRAQSAVQ